MTGNIKGGKKASRTNKERYGKDFYKKIGSLGGKLSRNCGFASQKVGPDGLTGAERAKIAGKIGGSVSKRKKVKA